MLRGVNVLWKQILTTLPIRKHFREVIGDCQVSVHKRAFVHLRFGAWAKLSHTGNLCASLSPVRPRSSHPKQAWPTILAQTGRHRFFDPISFPKFPARPVEE